MKSMIACVLLISLSVLMGSALHLDSESMGNLVKCAKQHNVKLDDFKKLKNTDPEKIIVEAVSHDMKCAVHCFAMKKGTMDKDGKFKAETLRANLIDNKKEPSEAAFNECNEISGSSSCETAFLAINCMAIHKVGGF